MEARETAWIAGRFVGGQRKEERTLRQTRRQRNFSPSTNPSVSSDQSIPMDYSDHTLSPCIRQVAQLELKPKVTKQPKLFSSKSLSQLVPRALFFKKRNSADNATLKGTTGNSSGDSKSTGTEGQQSNKFITAKSFPSTVSTGFANMMLNNQSNAAMEHDESDDIYEDNELGNNIIMPEGVLEIESTRRMQLSVSTIELPRHSSRNSITLLNDNCTLAHASLSPIAGSQESKRVSLAKATGNNKKLAPATMVTAAAAAANFGGDSSDKRAAKIDAKSSSSNNNNNNNSTKTLAADSCKEANEAAAAAAAANDVKSKKKTSERCKAIKNTTLVLRDVKNSIGLRMRAKQESQAFSKLREEVATPPTKLYSPFNIYTPDNRPKDSKSRRKLALNGGADKEAGDVSIISTASDLVEATARRPIRDTPKRRAALQHKLHLLQGTKFAFDSPTGRLRETVKDVEQFQQCIEDISKAIRARGQQAR